MKNFRYSNSKQAIQPIIRKNATPLSERMVSIIIINYNTFELTCNCIKSIIEKTAIPYEIILVDNASSECDANIFKEKFPEILLIRSSKNLGFAGGNNLGIRASTGKYVLLLNSDTVLINNAIDIAFERIQKDAGIGALSCQLCSKDGSLQAASNEFETISKNVARALRLQRFIPKYAFMQLNLEEEHETEWIWGTFFLFPRTVLSIFPDCLLPADFFMYGEDKQWCYILRKHGYKIWYYPAAKIMHLIGASSQDKAEAKVMKYFLPNEFAMYAKERGRFYALSYFLSSSFYYFLSFKKSTMKRGVQYLTNGFKLYFE
ncbi:glycosyltransferase family 2 protein [Pinibacter soli]|uniref:Glycosyltransferase family 2 protein n=1 Tax=Pinibacter soli TaxID=3044211 RepID=A0ABT6R832_9BACT|nr:glycosyltransferase family 2 protein [Pinibacter soli]MDI3318628.1 glycosyltransferase family 2 protein [Pinibacter soli]